MDPDLALRGDYLGCDQADGQLYVPRIRGRAPTPAEVFRSHRAVFMSPMRSRSARTADLERVYGCEVTADLLKAESQGGADVFFVIDHQHPKPLCRRYAWSIFLHGATLKGLGAARNGQRLSWMQQCTMTLGWRTMVLFRLTFRHKPAKRRESCSRRRLPRSGSCFSANPKIRSIRKFSTKYL